MIVKNIKSFIEFYKFLGVTDCIYQHPRIERNSSLSVREHFTPNSEAKINKQESNKSKSVCLEDLKSEIQSLDCNLKEIATNLVFSDGNHNSKIMILGEAPGASEDIDGRPFVATY